MLKSIFRWVRSAALVAACAHAAATHAAPTAVFGFGDSLMDTGNLFLAIGAPPSPPYAGGRFSNGPLWAENIAGSMGFGLVPSLIPGGNNFAWAGARSGTGVTSGFIPNVGTQVGQYLALSGGVADAGALYIIDGGGNDVQPIVALANPVAILTAISNTVNNMLNSIKALAAAGAKNFLIADVPNVGGTPKVQAIDAANPGLNIALGATAVSNAINQGVLQGLMALHGADPTLDLGYLDLFALSQAVHANPAAFGFTNDTDPCFNGVTVCANPDEYVYWDDFHPTAAVGRLIAAQPGRSVPEPGAMLLTLLAMATLAAFRSKKQLRAATIR